MDLMGPQTVTYLERELFVLSPFKAQFVRVRSLIAAATLVALAACGGGGSSSPSPTPTPAPGAVTSSLSSNTVSLVVGASFGNGVTFTQTNASGNLTVANTCNTSTGGAGVLSAFSGTSFSYSSATGIATYTAGGQLGITAVAAGTCTITATPNTGTPLVVTVTVTAAT